VNAAMRIPGFAVNFLLAARSFSKIHPTIVRRDSVDVVYFNGVYACLKFPDQTVNHVNGAIYRRLVIAGPVQRTGYVSRAYARPYPWTAFPMEQPGIHVVVEPFGDKIAIR